MQTIIVVNGSHDWRGWFPGFRVHQTYLQRSRWLFDTGRLIVEDRHGQHRPDGVLWRLGAVAPHPSHRACLQLLRLAQVPCVNPVSTLLRGYDRLAMLAELREAGLPVVDFQAAVGDGALESLGVDPPVVLKVGNLHGGMGKARAPDAESWRELVTLAALHQEGGYATCEPYLDYVRDIRCLAVGDQMWAMARRGARWRANVDTEHHELIDPPEAMAAWTRQAMAQLGAEVLGLDFLEMADGQVVLLESNDIPGVLGFPPEVPQAIAARLRARIEGSGAPG